nr:ATP-binding protein [Anaerolineae bacterium]
ARLDSGKLEVEFSKFEPQQVLDEIHLQMQPLAEVKGLRFFTTVAENLPEMLENDPYRLRQLLTHLVGNAIKFTEQGEVRIELFRLNTTYWGIKVIDTGPGIPLEAHGYIFEPFRQVDGSVTRRHGGTGLGLSIVKQLAELMGGEIGVQSQLGQGTTFVVTLPFQPKRSRSSQ